MVDVVHIADVLAHALDMAGDPDGLVPPPAAGAWGRLGLSQPDLRSAIERAEQQFNGFANLLG